jgi:hypothetical protein
MRARVSPVGEPHREHEDEREHLDEPEPSQVEEERSPWIEEHRLHVEEDEEHRHHVEPDGVALLGRDDLRLAALEGIELRGERARRSQQAVQAEHRAGHDQGEDEDQQHAAVVGQHGSPSVAARSAGRNTRRTGTDRRNRACRLRKRRVR